MEDNIYKERLYSNIQTCKRVNNNKRQWLLLNKQQCKHYPSSPREAIELFQELARQIRLNDNEKVLVVGFAETATAIGVVVANSLGCDYIHTTREDIQLEYVDFSEEHSHAVEQRIRRVEFEAYDRILFVEDEVSTGRTILNIIDKLTEVVEKDMQYSVASLINGMNCSSLTEYRERGIDLYYIAKVNNTHRDTLVEDIHLDGDVFDLYKADTIIRCSNVPDARGIINTEQYKDEILKAVESLPEYEDKFILVLGTEETMYPAMIIGSYLEDGGNIVRMHATTRSPIGVVKRSTNPEYPLNSAYKLRSCYEDERETYIYNLRDYDHVIIVTDAPESSKGLEQLILTLRVKGNDDITQIILERS